MAAITADLSTFESTCGAGANSPACADYVKDRIGAIKREAYERKDATWSSLSSGLENAYESDYYMANYTVRNANVTGVQTAIRGLNEQAQNSNDFNKYNSRRQFEINEWYYQNKLETLFFLQVFLIAVLIMTIILYLLKTGYITSGAAGITVAVLGIVVIIVGVSRYFYTARTRDNRLWHRRRFGEMSADKPDLIKCPGAGAPGVAGAPTTINLNAIFSEKTTECAAALKPAYNAWFDGVSAEIKNYELANAPVSSIFGADGRVTLPDKCK